VILFCAVCSWFSVGTILIPPSGSAEYHFREWKNGDPPQPWRLDRALALNPRLTRAWIARGLEAESHGDRPRAEQGLLRAARIDHTYLPRWTLANFYLRAGDLPGFWTWARGAAEMTHEPYAVFRLCWRVSGDGKQILERAIPTERRVRREYLNFLVSTGRLRDAEPLADELSRTVGPGDVDSLLRFCDLALARFEAPPAIAGWNALAEWRLIPHGRFTGLTNGDFSLAPLGRGFDWRPRSAAGAALSFAAGEMSVALSGRQAEALELIAQYVPLYPGSSPEFRYRARTRDLKDITGLSWNFVNARTGAVIASTAVPASPGEFLERVLAFAVPPGCDLARLILNYQRPAGSRRAEGAADFTSLRLTRRSPTSDRGGIPAP